jgi:hypothetical protein
MSPCNAGLGALATPWTENKGRVNKRIYVRLASGYAQAAT